MYTGRAAVRRAPLVVLSISLDTDDAKWKDLVAHNGMAWLHYREGRFTGPMAQLFPHTFTIDSDVCSRMSTSGTATSTENSGN